MAPVIDFDDQAVVIAADIEDHARLVPVSGPEISLDLVKIPPVRRQGPAVPRIERRAGAGVFADEPFNLFVVEDDHN
jgi:hypothetical protein